jgi:hypothetical protein
LKPQTAGDYRENDCRRILKGLLLHAENTERAHAEGKIRDISRYANEEWS